LIPQPLRFDISPQPGDSARACGALVRVVRHSPLAPPAMSAARLADPDRSR
jgi:hypothetical protein